MSVPCRTETGDAPVVIMPASTKGTPTAGQPEAAGSQASRAPVPAEPTERAAGFRRLLESTRIVQWEADARTWAFTYVGPQAGRLLGYPVEQWYASDFWAAHVHPDDREWVVRYCEQAAREREAYELEYRMIAASGQSIWLHDIVVVDRVDGAPTVIRGFLIDVSQRRRAEATARASEARLRQLIEQAPNAIVAVRSEGQIAFVNRQAERMFGYRRGERVGRGIEHLVSGQPDVQRLLATQGDGRSPEADPTGDDTVPINGMRRDGGTFPAEINFSPLETDEGRVIVSTIRDISKRRLAEIALRQSEERFRIAATLGSDIVAELDITSGDVEWFGHVDEALGYERGEFPRTFDGSLGQLHPEDCDRVRAEVEREVVELRRGMSAECRIRAKDGSYRHWSVRVAPRLEGQERPTRFVAVCSDLTDQIAARAEALQHRDALAHFARVSSLGELTATLAHELNQPLAAILSDAQTAMRLLDRDTPDIPQVQEVLRDIVADDRRASAIIQRLRDMMRRGPAARERIDLCQVVREVREIMRSGLSAHGITLVPDFDDGLPAIVADRIQIQQVVVNLVTNAMQAMDGQTDAALTLGVRGLDDGWQVVSVTDTGPGIAASALDTMFEPFSSSRPGGLGMGLSISRSIIEAHEGKIWGENRPDGGAVVAFGLLPEGVAGA